jgi:hypothetical protein
MKSIDYRNKLKTNDKFYGEVVEIAATCRSMCLKTKSSKKISKIIL